MTLKLIVLNLVSIFTFLRLFHVWTLVRIRGFCCFMIIYCGVLHMRLGTWTPQTIAQQESSKIFRFVQSLTIFPLRTRNHSFKSSELLDAPSAVSLSLSPEAVTCSKVRSCEACRGETISRCCSALVLQCCRLMMDSLFTQVCSALDSGAAITVVQLVIMIVNVPRSSAEE